MRTPTEYNYDDRNLLLLVLKKKALLSWPSCVSLIFENSQLHFTFSSFFYIFCLFPRKDGRGEKVPIFFSRNTTHLTDTRAERACVSVSE